eukprot:350436-Chlamydomonas_euryale.AAC.10
MAAEAASSAGNAAAAAALSSSTVIAAGAPPAEARASSPPLLDFLDTDLAIRVSMANRWTRGVRERRMLQVRDTQ